ncbi:hypothetical protein B2J88_42380 [Rhodococcus sp. SRB_17]|nr:hypothetical protein [Rhodococcus sp. SRB_17]
MIDSMSSTDLVGLVAGLSGGSVLLIALALAMPRVVGDEPNSLIGIRTAATTSTPEAWQVAHRAAVPYLRRTARVGGLGLCAQVVTALVWGPVSVGSAIAAAAVFAGVTIMLIDAARRGDRAARQLSAGDRRDNR